MLGALLAHVQAEGGPRAVARVLRSAGERRTPAQLSDPSGWSTYDQACALFEAAIEVLGDPNVGRKAGARVLRQYAGGEVLGVLRSLGSPAEILRLYPAISAKQSTVTRAEVVEVGDGTALLSIRSQVARRHRVFCDYTDGAIEQFPVLFGLPAAEVVELECQVRGDERCLVQVTWQPDAPPDEVPDPAAELLVLREQLAVMSTRFEALESVARELSSARDIDSMLRTIIRHAQVAVRAPRYLLAVRLPGDTAERVHHVGFSDAEAQQAAARLLAAGPDAGTGSTLVVDVVSARAHFGRLAAFYPDGLGFLPQERSLLLAYAGHAAAALETAAALGEARDRNETLGALLALGTALAQVRTRWEVADHLARAMPDVVGCDEAHVLLWDPDDAMLTRAASGSRTGADHQPDGPRTFHDGRVARRLLELPQPSTASAISDDPVVRGVAALTGLPATLVVPLTARGDLLGVLAAGWAGGAVPAEGVVRERLAGVASLATTAFDNATLLDEVRHQAMHDAITGLPNARLFEDRVSQSLSVARRSGSRLALLFVDLDRFKAVNDGHGHRVGDDLLRSVADRLRAIVRETDTVARIGGDEFGVLLLDVGGKAEAAGVARSIVAAVRQPFVVRGLHLTVGASIGIAMLPDVADTYDTAISHADAAMYQAKAAGRGQSRFAGDP